jgi:hypothetical protein
MLSIAEHSLMTWQLQCHCEACKGHWSAVGNLSANWQQATKHDWLKAYTTMARECFANARACALRPVKLLETCHPAPDAVCCKLHTPPPKHRCSHHRHSHAQHMKCITHATHSYEGKGE